MGKKQLIALTIVLVAFFAFFYKAYLDFDMTSPFVNLVFFIAFAASTMAALAIGNNGER